jgi:putative long chain acyl-CoA synthase
MVVSYTWTLLAGLADAHFNPSERDHAIRLFIGSGIPSELWRRVEQRFAPARVLEFYASTQAEIVLVNLSGRNQGAAGLPLPGSAPLRIARYDAGSGQLVEGPRGFAIECEAREVGMLPGRLGEERPRGPRALRGTFEPGDAWLQTADLFRRDGDGDFWLVGPACSLFPTPDGPVAPRDIEHALGGLPGVRLAVAYGVPDLEGEGKLAADAVALEPDKVITSGVLDTALAALAPAQRPAIIRVVDRLPVTASFRPVTGDLRREGLTKPDCGYAFRRDASGRYAPLAQAAAPAAEPVHH